MEATLKENSDSFSKNSLGQLLVLLWNWDVQIRQLIYSDSTRKSFLILYFEIVGSKLNLFVVRLIYFNSYLYCILLLQYSCRLIKQCHYNAKLVQNGPFFASNLFKIFDKNRNNMCVVGKMRMEIKNRIVSNAFRPWNVSRVFFDIFFLCIIFAGCVFFDTPCSAPWYNAHRIKEA